MYYLCNFLKRDVKCFEFDFTIEETPVILYGVEHDIFFVSKQTYIIKFE